jgi:hypothetical protein
MRQSASGLALLLIGLPLCAAAQQSSLLVQWSSNATEYRGQNGRRVTVICPAGGSPGDVYGTDVYTDDSLVCPAAVHAGVIGFGGGVVTLAIAPGASAYRSSSRNGITSRPFGAWQGSFSFDRSGTPGQVEWKTTARGLSTSVAPTVTLACPPNGELGTVWGTDRYTDDSSICSAAVHAGVIDSERGGMLTLHATGELATSTGISRNGVVSREYGSWPGGFSVSAVSGEPRTVEQAVAARAHGEPSAASSALPLRPRTDATPTRARPPLTRASVVSAPEDKAFSLRTLVVLGLAPASARAFTIAPLSVLGTAPVAVRSFDVPHLEVRGTP